MKRHLVSLAMLVCVGVAWFLWRQHALEAPPAGLHGSHGAAADGPAPPPPHVRQISREDRERLVEQLAAARGIRASHAAHAAHAAGDGPVPALPADDHTHDLDRVGAPVLDALNESIPFLASCYADQAAAGQKTAVAFVTLTNDPDIGAVIDADQILDETQAPLPPALDACLRSTIQTLQLPPLDAGDTVKLQYSFVFAGKK